jgi:hypothetical protein
MDIFWEAASPGSIGNVANDVEKVSHTVESQNAEIKQINRRIDRLSLACQAMWELLRDATDFEEKDIFAKMQEVDLRDGVADGKMTPQTRECPSCKRQSNARRNICIYCGSALPADAKPAFS